MRTPKTRSVGQAPLLPFIAATATILPKKSVKISDEPTSAVDFHLQVVERIDALLGERKAPEACAPVQAPPPAPMRPVEPRQPFIRQVEHVEPALGAETISRPHPVPEEFLQEVIGSEHPSFRFVTSLESPEDAMHIRSPAPHIEVIDLQTLRQTSLDTTHLAPRQEVVILSKVARQARSDAAEEVKVLSGLSLTGKKPEKGEQSYIPVDLTQRVAQLRERERHEAQEREAQEAGERKKKKPEMRHAEASVPDQQQDAEPYPSQAPFLQEQALPLPQPQPTQEATAGKPSKAEKLQAKLAERQAKLDARLKKQHDRALLKAQKQLAAVRRKQEKAQPKEKKGKHEAAAQYDEDLAKVLRLTDTLLGQLPDEVIERFAHSPDFELYEKVMAKYNLK